MDVIDWIFSYACPFRSETITSPKITPQYKQSLRQIARSWTNRIGVHRMETLMRTLAIGFLLMSTLTFAVLCVAQDDEIPIGKKFAQPYLDFVMEGGDGYVGVGLVTRPGVELWIKRVNLNFETAVSTTDKMIIHSGTTYRVNGNGYINFKKYFLAGGGYTWGKSITSDYTKQSSHPYITGGVLIPPGGDMEGTRFVVDYLFAGTDVRNGVRGARFHFLLPITSIHSNKLFINLGTATYSVYETDCPSCQRELTGAVEIGFRIQR